MLKNRIMLTVHQTLFEDWDYAQAPSYQLPALLVKTREQFGGEMDKLMEAVRFWEDEIMFATVHYGAEYSLGGTWGIFLKIDLPPDQGFYHLHDLYEKLAEKSGVRPSFDDYPEISRRTWSFVSRTTPKIAIGAFFSPHSEVCKVVEIGEMEAKLAVICDDSPGVHQ